MLKKILKTISPPKQTILFIYTFIFNLIVFSLIRLFFLIKYHKLFSEIALKEILLSFLVGIRFDASTITFILGIFFLILHLPGKWKFSKIIIKPVWILLNLLLFVSLFTLIADTFYYEFSGKRLTFEVFSIINSKQEIIPTLLMVSKNYFFPLILFILFFAVFYTTFKNLFFYILRNFHYHSNIIKDIIYLFLYSVLIVILARGGLQLKPLRVSYAFRNDNIYLAHLSLNGLYTAANTLRKGNIKRINYFPYDEALKTIRETLKTENEKFLNKEFPLLRKLIRKDKINKKLNVIIFIMESWTSKYITPELTPFFYSLRRRGVYFENFYATGSRSPEGILSIIASIPHINQFDFIGSTLEGIKIRTIPQVLKEAGYRTIFFHGARLGSFGFDAFSKLSGFEKFVSKNDFDLKKVKWDGVWGVYDHYVFERINEEAKKIKKPFLFVVFSLSSHGPYKLPDEKFRIFKEKDDLHKFFNTLYYSDWALKTFFEKAKKEDYFKNTLFIITGDHTVAKGLKGVSNLHKIPCLFYAPEYLTPYFSKKIGSQIDIQPSLIDILGIEKKYSSFGKSLFSKTKGFAFISSGNIYGWIKNNYLLIHNTEKPLSFYNLKIDPDEKNNILTSKNYKNYEKELLSFIQIGRELLIKNKIFPTDLKNK